MSRYNNVKVLLDTAENYNLEELSYLVYRLEESQEAEAVAEDIAFVLISMWAMVPEGRKRAFTDRLTQEMVDIEVKAIFADEEFKQETNCKNCAGAMWWEPDTGWFHNHPHCIDPDPFLG